MSDKTVEVQTRDIAAFIRTGLEQGVLPALFPQLDPEEMRAGIAEGYYENLPPTPSLSDEERWCACEVAARMWEACLKNEDLKEVAAELVKQQLRNNGKLVPFLARFTTSVLDEEFDSPPKKGPGQHANDHRDLVLSLAVDRLVSRGYTKFRNNVSVRACACSIVADAYNNIGGNISYEAVKRIIQNQDKLQPKYLPPWFKLE